MSDAFITGRYDQGPSDPWTKYKWFAVFGFIALFIAIGAFIGAIIADVRPSPINVSCGNGPVKVRLYGYCDAGDDTPTTIPISICQVGPVVIVEVPKFTCDATTASAGSLAPLQFKLPAGLKTNYSVPSGFFSSDVTHDGSQYVPLPPPRSLSPHAARTRRRSPSGSRARRRLRASPTCRTLTMATAR